MIEFIPLFIRKKILLKLDIYDNRKGFNKGYLKLIIELFNRNYIYTLLLAMCLVFDAILNIPILIIRILCYVPYKIYDFFWSD